MGIHAVSYTPEWMTEYAQAYRVVLSNGTTFVSSYSSCASETMAFLVVDGEVIMEGIARIVGIVPAHEAILAEVIEVEERIAGADWPAIVAAAEVIA